MVSGFALDCSVALAWALPDEGSEAADAFWDEAFSNAEIWVPALWWYEIANALAVARKRNRIAAADHTRLMSLFMDLPVRTDALFGADAFFRYGSLACENALSAYDAAYLELAFRRGLVLATLDERLVEVAKKSGLKTWPEL